LFVVILFSISLTYAIVIDDDSDGVPDSDDKCLGSLSDLVDINGCDCEQKTGDGCDGSWCCEEEEFCDEYEFRARCVRDSDEDGVFDISDRCSDTSGSDVGDYGCSCSQIECDDKNQCTDDLCNEAECVFVNNDDNDCGEGKKCQEGECVEVYPVTLLRAEPKKEEEKFAPNNYVWSFVLLAMASAVIVATAILHRGNTKKRKYAESEERLKNYVMFHLNRGYPPHHIRWHLLNQGWEQEFVDNIFKGFRR